MSWGYEAARYITHPHPGDIQHKEHVSTVQPKRGQKSFPLTLQLTFTIGRNKDKSTKSAESTPRPSPSTHIYQSYFPTLVLQRSNTLPRVIQEKQSTSPLKVQTRNLPDYRSPPQQRAILPNKRGSWRSSTQLVSPVTESPTSEYSYPGRDYSVRTVSTSGTPSLLSWPSMTWNNNKDNPFLPNISIEDQIPGVNDVATGVLPRKGKHMRQRSDSVSSNDATISHEDPNQAVMHMPFKLITRQGLHELGLFDNANMISEIPAEATTTIWGVSRALQEVYQGCGFSDGALLLALGKRMGRVPNGKNVVYPEDLEPYITFDQPGHDAEYWMWVKRQGEIWKRIWIDMEDEKVQTRSPNGDIVWELE